DEMFVKLQHELPDLRIISVHKNDTIEAPYLLKVLREQRHESPISFRRINEARTPEGYQYVFELPEVQDVNEIEVFFNEINFDRRVRVEFSQYVDGPWAVVPETFRIVSMKNNDVDFQYTRLRFATTKARFFRITILNVADPKLTEARVTNVTTTEGTYRTYAAVDSIFNDKQNKQTVIDLKLRSPVPVSFVQLNVSSPFDYHRSIFFQAVVDSVKTQNGWEYSYRHMHGGLLSSLINEPFKFNNVVTSRLRITIQNNDNRPLDFSGFVVKGNIHQLVSRFDDPKSAYYLLYGNPNVANAQYDIHTFENRIPTDIKEATLGVETVRLKPSAQSRSPLFENKAWLWVAMGLVMLLLGVFTLRMMRTR
ncbi:MAG TPA: hypothetical protein VEY71_05350, partial [Chitinophagales bacterium]|nr:hypothetical protein [Chitinophagales bacterium]